MLVKIVSVRVNIWDGRLELAVKKKKGEEHRNENGWSKFSFKVVRCVVRKSWKRRWKRIGIRME